MIKKKNLLILMSDQMQHEVITKNSSCLMPNTRGIIEDGVFCTHAYSTNPICSPARASLMTGLFPHNHGMVDVTHAVPEYRAKFDNTLDMFSKVLKDEGYNTAYYGKWHVERTHQLENFGYDEYLTEKDLPSLNVTPIDRLVLRDSRTGYDDKVVGGVYSESQEVSEEYFVYSKAMDFINQHADDANPFCTFISTYAPHDPYTVPKEVWDLYDGVDIQLPESYYDDLSDKPHVYKRLQQVWDTFNEEDVKKIRRFYYSYCTLVDLQIGRMVKTLKDLNLYDDTLIVFLSDHGDMLGSHKLFAKGVPCFEEAYKLPMFFKFPHSEHSSTVCDGYVSGNDIAPTLLDILGCQPLRNRIDGHSVKTMLEGGGIGENTYCMAEFFGQRYGFTQRITWKNNFKYVFNPFDRDELYDLNKDPHELVNQIDNPDYQEKVIELATLMQKITFDTKDDTMIETQYYMTRLAPVGPYKKKNESEYAIYNKKF